MEIFARWIPPTLFIMVNTPVLCDLLRVFPRFAQTIDGAGNTPARVVIISLQSGWHNKDVFANVLEVQPSYRSFF